MRECRNYFVKKILKGKFDISDSKISLSTEPLIGSYVRIIGSTLNDGVYKIKDNLITLEGSSNEEFVGAICFLAVPLDFIELAEDIKDYNTALADKPTFGLLKSESFAGYSYTLASGKNGQVASWKEVFSTRLDNFRKMFEERVV